MARKKTETLKAVGLSFDLSYEIQCLYEDLAYKLGRLPLFLCKLGLHSWSKTGGHLIERSNVIEHSFMCQRCGKDKNEIRIRH